MTTAFESLPRSLKDKARLACLGPDVPALLAHPNWEEPAPFVLWMHGRTAHKELDPGRYNRWLRAGIACCSIDLPGHGERFDEAMQQAEAAPDAVKQALGEVDEVVDQLDIEAPGGLFDRSRAAIGGMSMGGMIALRRLCDPHGFTCAAVEATTGDLERLYFRSAQDEADPWPVRHERGEIRKLNPLEHLTGFEPLPLLALHSEADRMVPFPGQRDFIERLREHYRERGADPDSIELHTWPETGAPSEHIGFGRFSAEAKDLQTAFFRRHLIGGAEATP